MARPLIRGAMLAAAICLAAGRADALEQLCDSSYQNCRTQLLTLIQNENVEIDVGLWFMEDARYSNAIVSKFQAGVTVRILMDPRVFPQDSQDKTIMDQLQAAGIPMRKRVASGIEHWKAMIFAGQNTVYFGSANFSANAFVPVTPYVNYVDETIYYTDDASVVNSFKTKFDNAWVDTTNYASYANPPSSLARSYPVYSIDPELNFVPDQSYANRAVKAYGAESTKIDVQMFRITDQRHTNAMIDAFTNRHVPIRMIVDPGEYRNPNRLWDAWNVDRMWAVGIPIRITVHQGENHGKLVLLYGQGITIFGSSNWSSPSGDYQHEHNYFTAKSNLFTWFVDQFNRKWNNTAPTGDQETGAFTPLPPDKPVYVSPASGAVGVATSGVVLKWDGGPWAHVYDVYFGTSPTPPLFAQNLNLGPDDPTKSPKQYQTFTLPTLTAGTTYYWQIVSKTMANMQKAGPIWSFTTTGTPPPPPSGASDVVMWASNVPAANVHGNWNVFADSSAAGGQALQNPDQGQAKISPALASPANYFEQTFTADSGVGYHLWVRMRAQNNSFSNDSIHVQFGDSVDSLGTATMRIGTTSSAEVVLQDGPSGAADQNWGWADNGWGSLGATIYFAATGTHTVRVQQREDGAVVDQIVLSPSTYFSSPPGPRQNDATILPNTDGSSPPPPPPSGTDVVMWATNVPSGSVHGNWVYLADTTAAGGRALQNPDAGAAKISPALASPTSFFEQTFNADASKAYHLWVRMRAQNNSTSNDSVHVQFSDSVNASGGAVMRIGTSGSAEIVLQDGSSDSGDSGWGWADADWNGPAAPVYFATSGSHTIRIQQREDGAIVDQILLSPSTYFSSPPGPRDNDSTILPNTDSTATASLPAPWTQTDVGAVTIAGSAQYASGTFTVTASGADIWGTADAFHYVYQPLSGDGTITARVASVRHAATWSKAGVMVRETLSAASKHVYMLVSAAKGVAMQWRPTTGGTSLNASGSLSAAPRWVRLVRSGDTFTGYESPDGATWTAVSTQTVPMIGDVYVGLAVTSHNTSATTTAAFDSVSAS